MQPRSVALMCIKHDVYQNVNTMFINKGKHLDSFSFLSVLACPAFFKFLAYKFGKNQPS